MTESKAREFWLDMQDDPYSEDGIWTYKPRHRNHLIHVIEKSAYDKAVGALKKYGQHTKECICHIGHAAYENACDCGFDEALKELGEL